MSFSFFWGSISSNFTPEELRKEIFLLGGRHQGNALAGAMAELDSAGLSRERRRLLHAVVKTLAPPYQSEAVATVRPVSSNLFDYTEAVLVLVAAGLAFWLLMLT